MQILLCVALLALSLAASTCASAINVNKQVSSHFNFLDLVHPNNDLDTHVILGRAPAVFGTEYTGNAVVEMSIASDDRRNIGDLNRAGLYHAIYIKLVELCPEMHEECDLDNSAKFAVKWLSNANNANPFPQKDGWATLKVTSFRFQSNQIRRLLIGSIAGAYEAMTDTERNCFDLTCTGGTKSNGYCKGKFDPHLSWDSTPTSDNNDRFCTVANKVSVFTFGGHLSVELDSKWHDVRHREDYHMGVWRCCETREAIDTKLDGLKGEMISVFGERGNKFRDVRCTGGCQENQRVGKVSVDEMLKDVINHLG